MNLLLKNGKLVFAHRIEESDLLIENGKISRLGKEISVKSIPELDLQGAYVLPGGIDPHVHLALPTPVGPSADDFTSGSRAALAGGTTTFIDFITPAKGEKLVDAYYKRKAEVNNCFCDYAFHMSIVEWRDSIPSEMEKCVNSCGITSFKTYLAYQKTIGIDFETLEKVMQTARKLNVAVTIHAELGNIIDHLRDEAVKNGQASLQNHPLTRPDYTEYEAIEKVVSLVRKTKCQTYIVHVSTQKSLEIIAQAQAEGLSIYAESCPQYFTFNNTVYEKPEEQALAYIISPPIRSEENRKGVLEHVLKGTVCTIGTDHCPFHLQQKQMVSDFTQIPNGTGGIQHRMSMLYTKGKALGMNMNQLSELSSSHAAQFFRLPKKGEIAPGYDADLVVWKTTEQKIKDQNRYSVCSLDIYAEENILGKADIVIKGGQIVYENGKLAEHLPQGNYLYRK